MRFRAVAAAAFAVVASSIVAPSLASSSQATLRPCRHGYAYAGYAGRDGADGVAATISATAPASVPTGHAAAWVGVGGIHAGPDGASEWLQAGIAAFPRVGPRVYVEAVSQGETRRFYDLGPAVVGRRYRVRVVEIRRDVWRAIVNGHAVGGLAYLPTAGSSWRPVVTAESWTAGHAACNRYAYEFDAVSTLETGRWDRLAAAERIGTRVAGDGSSFSVSG